ncbi:acylglycerol kinase-like protein, partial [Leptotrombidium deliense]
NSLMKVYCEEALKIGDQILNPYSASRHITVILNPVSKDKKCKYLFEHYVAPLLHCAGIKVSVVQTESQGEARGLMSVMADTDAVVVVGGNGTVQDSITGLLRRVDADVVVPSMPIGIIPVTNHPLSFSQLFDLKQFFDKDKKRVAEVKMLAEATMAVVRETVKAIDVVKIEGKEMGTTVFALNTIDFGLLSDLTKKADKYWYYGSHLKPYYSLIRGTLFKSSSSLEIPEDIRISYTEPCSGCCKCYKKYAVSKPAKVDDANVSRRWWHSFIPRQLGSNTQPVLEPTVDYTKIVNENCGVWKSLPENHLLNVSVQNSFKNEKLKLVLHTAGDVKKSDLIEEGVKMYRKENFTSNIAKNVEAEHIRIEFLRNDNQSENSSINADECVNKESNEESQEKEIISSKNVPNLWFRIDNEDYEAQNVEISLMPKKLRVYC